MTESNGNIALLDRAIQRADPRGGRIIVVCNEKGGSGKSTVAMQLIVGLLRRGHGVASIDLDTGQASLSRYIENRQRFAERQDLTLRQPEHHGMTLGDGDSIAAREADERSRFGALLGDLLRRNDYIVVDTPGSSGFLPRLALGMADRLVTPLNDSFLDLDVLVHVDVHDLTTLTLSPFAQTVMNERGTRQAAGRPAFDWYVLRNRLTNIGSRNKQDISELLHLLAKRFDFTLLPGFTERVIYRELFLRGLTVLDVRDAGTGVAMSMSHLHARQEIHALLQGMDLPVEAEPRAGVGSRAK